MEDQPEAAVQGIADPVRQVAVERLVRARDVLQEHQLQLLILTFGGAFTYSCPQQVGVCGFAVQIIFQHVHHGAQLRVVPLRRQCSRDRFAEDLRQLAYAGRQQAVCLDDHHFADNFLPD